MFFIYIIAIAFAALTTIGAIAVLTLDNVWTMDHSLVIFVALSVAAGSIWGAYQLAKAAIKEGKYWF